jgi:hypothetical protein
MEILIGKVKHFYGHVPAMVVELDEDLKIGDEIIVKKRMEKRGFAKLLSQWKLKEKRSNLLKLELK